MEIFIFLVCLCICDLLFIYLFYLKKNLFNGKRINLMIILKIKEDYNN